jgi:hypothetical protein
MEKLHKFLRDRVFQKNLSHFGRRFLGLNYIGLAKTPTFQVDESDENILYLKFNVGALNALHLTDRMSALNIT